MIGLYHGCYDNDFVYISLFISLFVYLFVALTVCLFAAVLCTVWPGLFINIHTNLDYSTILFHGCSAELPKHGELLIKGRR